MAGERITPHSAPSPDGEQKPVRSIREILYGNPHVRIVADLPVAISLSEYPDKVDVWLAPRYPMLNWHSLTLLAQNLIPPGSNYKVDKSVAEAKKDDEKGGRVFIPFVLIDDTFATETRIITTSSILVPVTQDSLDGTGLERFARRGRKDTQIQTKELKREWQIRLYPNTELALMDLVCRFNDVRRNLPSNDSLVDLAYLVPQELLDDYSANGDLLGKFFPGIDKAKLFALLPVTQQNHRAVRRVTRSTNNFTTNTV